MKNKYVVNKVIDFIESKEFGFLVVFLLLISILCSVNFNEMTKINALIGIYSNGLFLSLGILPVSIYLAYYASRNFETDYLFKTRFKNKKEYEKIMKIYLLCLEILIFIISLLCVFISLNIFNYEPYIVEYVEKIHYNNLLYFIYVFIKLFFIVSIFTLINFSLIIKKQNIFIIVLDSIFIIEVFLSSYTINDIENMKNFTINFPVYLSSTTYYSSIKLDIIINGIFLLFMLLINEILKKVKERIKYEKCNKKRYN